MLRCPLKQLYYRHIMCKENIGIVDFGAIMCYRYIHRLGYSKCIWYIISYTSSIAISKAIVKITILCICISEIGAFCAYIYRSSFGDITLNRKSNPSINLSSFQY